LALTAAVAITMPACTIIGMLLGWPFRFSLRSLMLLVLAAAVPCSWLAAEIEQARQQHDAVLAIRKGGGVVSYDYHRLEVGGDVFFLSSSVPRTPFWLRGLFGDDFFCRCDSVRIESDAEMQFLKRLPGVRELTLDMSAVTDAGLMHIRGVGCLRRLNLHRTVVTDTGMRALAGLTSLEELDLTETRIGDEGLKHLMGLPRLRRLDLIDTRVTNRGLLYLCGCANLASVDVRDTSVTEEDARRLADTLPNCRVAANSGDTIRN
jgi:hypothetical protein